MNNILRSTLIILAVYNASAFADSPSMMVNNKPDAVVLLGASYAKGWGISQIGGLQVINKGVGGEQSGDMLTRFESDVIEQHPQAVIVWGFINDVFRSDPAKIEDTINLTRSNIKKMVQLARLRNITPILATEVTIPNSEKWLDRGIALINRFRGKTSYQEFINQHVKATNGWLREYAKTEQIFLLDLEPVLSNPDGTRKNIYTQPDGSHLTEAAYRALDAYAATIQFDRIR